MVRIFKGATGRGEGARRLFDRLTREKRAGTGGEDKDLFGCGIDGCVHSLFLAHYLRISVFVGQYIFEASARARHNLFAIYATSAVCGVRAMKSAREYFCGNERARRAAQGSAYVYALREIS